MTKKIFFTVICCVLTLPLLAQRSFPSWHFGASAVYTDFGSANETTMGAKSITQFPQLSITAPVWKQFSANATVTFNGLVKNDIKYFAFDVNVRYYLKPFINGLATYALVGLGGADSDLKKVTTTFNAGAGLHYWITPRVGVQLQTVYKHSFDTDLGLPSHIQAGLGIVYKINTPNAYTKNTINYRYSSGFCD